MMSDSPMPTITRAYQTLSPRELGFEVGKNISFVVENTLCHGCGTCEAVCPSDAVQMQYKANQGIYLPDIDKERCTDCELCVQACPGFELDLTERVGDSSGLTQHHLVGPHARIHRAYTTNQERRDRAASGGVVTELVDYLLQSGQVDAAILVRMRPDDPLQAEGYIARSADELKASQKSKYCPVPLNRILKPIIRSQTKERFVFVGLPHHVHGLRLVQHLYPHVHDAIRYVVSTFTAHVPSQRATEFTLFKHGIEPGDVKSIEYRGGGNPGRMQILTKDGREHLVPHLHWTFSGHAFLTFFYPVREWLYFDKLSEWADLSCGDNWMKGLQEQEGASTVVTRSLEAEALIQRMISEGRVRATPMGAEDLVTDQELETKLNIGSRLKVWKWLGRKIPLYQRKFKVKRWELVSAARFALYVRLCEYPVPFQVMSPIIWADYHLRALPMRSLRRARRLLREIGNVFLPYRGGPAKTDGKLKVVTIGGYGHKDIGDEAMPHAIRVNLRKALGERLELVMLSYDPEATAEMHGESSKPDFKGISPGSTLRSKATALVLTVILLAAVRLERVGIKVRLWPSARMALDEISSADVVLNVGGGNITSVIPAELYKKCTTYWLANILGKPVFLSGQTMGPYEKSLARWYASFCLNKVRMISFRDKDTSRMRLEAIGVNRPIMFDAADDAITLEGISPAESKALLEQETGVELPILRSRMLVFMNLKASLNIFKGAGRDTSLDQEVALMAQIADALAQTYNCVLVLCPTDFTEGVDDRVYHERIVAKMRHKDAVFQITGEYTDDELIGMIGCADLVIGARYHFNVFAASRFVPFVGFASGKYQRTKLEGLANLCELPECYVDLDMEMASFDEAWPYVVNVVDNRDEIRSELRRKVPELQRRSLSVVTAVVEALGSTNHEEHGRIG